MRGMAREPERKSDTTVITIAHRLQTIMDSDKIVRIPFNQYSSMLKEWGFRWC